MKKDKYDDLAELVEAGFSKTKIAEWCGISQGNINYILAKHGLLLPIERRLEIDKLIKKGKNSAEIGKKIGKSESTIRNYIIMSGQHDFYKQKLQEAKRKKQKKQKKQLENLVEKGLTVKQIAKKTKITYEYTLNLLSRYELSAKRKYSLQQTIERIKQAFKKAKNWQEITDMTGLTYGTIRVYCGRHGIKKPNYLYKKRGPKFEIEKIIEPKNFSLKKFEAYKTKHPDTWWKHFGHFQWNLLFGKIKDGAEAIKETGLDVELLKQRVERAGSYGGIALLPTMGMAREPLICTAKLNVEKVWEMLIPVYQKLIEKGYSHKDLTQKVTEQELVECEYAI